MIDKIEDSLNGGYGGLLWEVTEDDCYKLKDVKFVPITFIDIGANVGVTSRYARQLFPACFIVSVEPHKPNIEVFKQFTDDNNLVLIEKAIGSGKVWHGLTAANGSGETYLSSGVGFPAKEMSEDDRMEISEVETITLSELVETYIEPDERFIVKIDCEGNEHTIFFDDNEMTALRKAEYICAEIHRYALTGREWQEVQDKMKDALYSLETTHNCSQDGVHFFATKK